MSSKQPAKRCENCVHFYEPYCTLMWNNMDESYMIPDRDFRYPNETCSDWEYNEFYEEDE